MRRTVPGNGGEGDSLFLARDKIRYEPQTLVTVVPGFGFQRFLL
jgi:hypothetical protein